VAAFRYLVVGGGLAADAACRGIREHDSDGSIGLLGEEPHAPYARPLLSKGLWQGKDEAKIWCRTADLGVDLLLGRVVTAIDLQGRTVTEAMGGVHGYDRLLLATGARPRRLPSGGDDVIYFRTLDDYRRLRGLADGGGRFTVIGGGFIGAEIAAALCSQGCDVTMIFPEAGVGAGLFPAELSAFVTDYYRARGVEIFAGQTVSRIERADGGLQVRTADHEVTGCRGVVAGIGVVPRTELAAAAGLPVDGGIVVDALGRVGGREDIYAAGDVASFPSAALGIMTRVEHEDHAISHGRAVGENMAGAGRPYEHLPYFYSDLFDLGYEAVGEVTPRHETVADWKEPNREGVVYYLAGGLVRGVLLWNTWGRVDAARELIRAGVPFAEAGPIH
jgi:3-phenylpropionate/trans-cinnamate dioxygenase ferredoxin reductase component